MKRALLLGVMIMAGLNLDAAMPAAGDAAPAFEGVQDNGEAVSLTDYLGKWLALYFYPKADTPGCTKQACSLRDGIAELREEGIHILGVSIDTVEDQAAFKAKYNLPFPLLADKDGVASQAYGVASPGRPFARRVTFIISPEGKVADIIDQVNVTEHAQQVRDSLKAQTSR